MQRRGPSIESCELHVKLCIWAEQPSFISYKHSLFRLKDEAEQAPTASSKVNNVCGVIPLL